jgi:GT2 family glycosyltransferase
MMPDALLWEYRSLMNRRPYRASNVGGAQMASSLEIVLSTRPEDEEFANTLAHRITNTTPHVARVLPLGVETAVAVDDGDLVLAINGYGPHTGALKSRPGLSLITDPPTADFSRIAGGQPVAVIGDHAAIGAPAEWFVVPEPMPTVDDVQRRDVGDFKISVSFAPKYLLESAPESSVEFWRSYGATTTWNILSRLAQRGLIRLSDWRHDSRLEKPLGWPSGPAEDGQGRRMCDVVIDECVTGSYHARSLAGLAAGCVVVNALGRLPDIVEFFRRCSGTPAIPFTFSDLSSLADVLTALAARNLENLWQEGEMTRDWALKHWDFESQWAVAWEPAVMAALSDRSRGVPVFLPAGFSRAGAPDFVRKLRTAEISVVIPTHNEGNRLLETVTALRDSLPVTGQIIVVDDQSTDDSTKPLTGLARVEVARPPTRQGVAGARNYGAALADGDILVFSDAHILPSEQWLEPLLVALQPDDVGSVAPGIAVMGRPGRRPAYGGYWKYWRENSSLAWGWLHKADAQPTPVPLLCGCFTAMRRAVFNEVGGFDGGMDIYGHEDAEMSFHLWSRGYRCMVAPAAVISHHFKERHNFTVDWSMVIHNVLRLGVVHFNADRLARLIERLRRHNGFPSAAAKIAVGDVWNRRQWVRTKRCRDDDWYFSHFNLE